MLLVCALAGCASGDRDPFEPYDPLEPFNRVSFTVNDALDRALVEPIARGYRFITPDFFRQAVNNVLRNLNSPLVFANQLLQGDIDGAAKAVGRFVVNSTLGLAGLIDVGRELGMEYEAEDLGQTLAVWGFKESPYLVIPLLGPSTIRDGIAFGVESYADPLTRYLSNNDHDRARWARTGVGVIAAREENIEVIEDLRETSVDYYAAVRSSFLQRRGDAIRDGAPAEFDFPEFDEVEETRRTIQESSNARPDGSDGSVRPTTLR